MKVPCHDRDSPEHAHICAYVCQDCGVEEPLLFKCAAFFSTWLESHNRLNGHSRHLGRSLPPDPASGGYVWTPIGFTVPEGHVLAMQLGTVSSGPERFICSCGATVTIENFREGWHERCQLLIDHAHEQRALITRIAGWGVLTRSPADTDS
jgi:hypothetical protein